MTWPWIARAPILQAPIYLYFNKAKIDAQTCDLLAALRNVIISASIVVTIKNSILLRGLEGKIAGTRMKTKCTRITRYNRFPIVAFRRRTRHPVRQYFIILYSKTLFSGRFSNTSDADTAAAGFQQTFYIYTHGD